MLRLRRVNREDAGRRRRLELLFALALVALAGLVGYGIVRDRAQTLATARQNALSIADGVQVHATELLRQSISSLEYVRAGLSQSSVDAVSALPLLKSSALFDKVSVALGVAVEGEIELVDSEGAPVDDADWKRALAAMLRASPPPASSSVLPLIRSPKGEVWYLPIAVDVPRRNAPAAVAFALIPATRFLSAAFGLHIVQNSFVALFTKDGTRLFRYLEGTGLYDVGPVVPGPAMAAWARTRIAGTTEGASPADGQVRILGYSPSPLVPLVVVAGIPKRDLTIAWLKRSATVSLLLLGGLAAIACLGMRIRNAAGEHLMRQEFLATHDALTGLPNRYGFNRHLAERIAAQPDKPFAVVLLDLNRFKEVNDTLGHCAGDKVLEIVGTRLNARYSNSEALVARLGGDELAVCVDHDDWLGGIAGLCEDLKGVIGQPMEVEGVRMELTASIGVAVYPRDADNPTHLMRCADIAMYSAKQDMDAYRCYSEGIDHFTSDALALKSEFAGAIREGQLTLAFQPKVRLSDGALVGVEALSRWIHPTRGAIPPSTFVPYAETTELIRPFTDHVLRGALEQARRWLDAGHRIPVAVNLSVNNLLDGNFVDHLQRLLLRYGVPGELLELEVTESALMRNPEAMVRRLHRIADLGVTLAIDDFGTGHSSLMYLKMLPVQVIKIDRTFINTLRTDAADQRIVRAAIYLGHEFGMTIVAEGVECAATGKLLQSLDCDLAQGYHYGRPTAAENITRDWLALEVAA